jgi:WD40 repeat protein
MLKISILLTLLFIVVSTTGCSRSGAEPTTVARAVEATLTAAAAKATIVSEPSTPASTSPATPAFSPSPIQTPVSQAAQLAASPTPAPTTSADESWLAAVRKLVQAENVTSLVQLADHEKLRFGRGKLFDMAVSPRSDLLAVATGLGVWLYDLDGPEDEGRLLPQDAMTTAVSWSPDGMHLAAMGFDGVIRIWDPLSGMLESTMGNCQGNIPTELEWSPDGSRIAAYCGDGAAVFDAFTGKWLSNCAYPVNSRPRFSWSPDGKYLGGLVGIAEEPSKNRLDLCRGDTGKFERTLMTSAEDERMTDAALSPDGSLIAVEVWKRPPPSNADRSRVVSIRLLDPTNGQVVREIKPDGGTIVTVVQSEPDSLKTAQNCNFGTRAD